MHSQERVPLHAFSDPWERFLLDRTRYIPCSLFSLGGSKSYSQELKNKIKQLNILFSNYNYAFALLILLKICFVFLLLCPPFTSQTITSEEIRETTANMWSFSLVCPSLNNCMLYVNLCLMLKRNINLLFL